MVKHSRLVACMIVVSLAAAASAQTTVSPCPGYNPQNNTNLACAIATASGTLPTGTASSLSATLAAQLSQLPAATAVSGSGVQFTGAAPGAAPVESLGTILTQRGETIGRHRLFTSFTYQRFDFESVDGLKMNNLFTAA